MTRIINLYGGPGTGKSTSAAYLFARIKMAGLNAELVRETAKDWAWEQRDIDPYSQFYLMGRQIRRESMLLGRVSHIITDAPVLLYDYYASQFSPPDLAAAVHGVVQSYYAQLKADGHEVEHIFLERGKAYNPAGRYQTEEQAILIDQGLIQRLGALRVPYTGLPTSAHALDVLAGRLVNSLPV